MRKVAGMGMHECPVPRGGLAVPLLAKPEELSRLRHLTRSHLARWGLHTLADTAELCVSELVANVVLHVGEGVPITLNLSFREHRLRIELTDPDPCRIPVRVPASDSTESGRGLALLDAMTADWGVVVRENSKITWCELDDATGGPFRPPNGHRPARAEALLTLYNCESATPGLLAGAASEEAAITLIADVLHWLRTRGYDPDTVLDHAQTRYEATLVETIR